MSKTDLIWKKLIQCIVNINKFGWREIKTKSKLHLAHPLTFSLLQPKS